MSIETELWRTVCEHLELDEAAPRIFAVLAAHLPVDALMIRRLEREPPLLTTVGIAQSPNSARNLTAKTDIDERLADQLLGMLAAGEPMIVLDRAMALTDVLLPQGVTGPVIAVPLALQGKAGGVALLVFTTPVEARHLGLLAPIAQPLRVAFENDRRIRELARMREALEADRAALLSRLQRQDISEVIVGASNGLSHVMERAQQVAPTDAPVLILGETGSGKEVIARAIHARSRRAAGPIVRVNCGAIPSELIDSELFGHERGSFTGALAQRKGWFERADGGTLFLDEIGELSAAAQVRLLRVVQDGTLERIGGERTIRVDVRVIAATHRQLESMVADGMFREDLWYRLSVFPIRLPALRERIEDLPELVAHFAERAGKRLGGARLVTTEADIELLRGYAWPGNIRELAAVIERAAILGNGKRLEVGSALGATSRALTRVTPEVTAESADKSIASLDTAMAAHIRRALQSCHGRIEGPFGAAETLDVNPHTLRARMRKLGIDWTQFRRAGGPTLKK